MEISSYSYFGSSVMDCALASEGINNNAVGFSWVQVIIK
jgi:hypothetical protein